MQTRLVCKPCLYAPLIFLPGLYARLLRATRVDLPLTTGMAAVLLCTVHSACTLDLLDPRLHRSQASTRDMLICIWLLSAKCLYANPAFIRNFTVFNMYFDCMV